VKKEKLTPQKIQRIIREYYEKIICQEIGQHRRNGQLPRKIQTTKTNPKRNRNSE